MKNDFDKNNAALLICEVSFFLMKAKAGTDLPGFFDLLSDEDKQKYFYLQLTLSSSACKNRRNRSKQTFERILETIKIYAVRSDQADWKRCLVCGIFWLENDQIVVNSKQICVLLSKSISSINGSLMLLHYYTIQNSREQVQSFLESIPLVKLKPATLELRQWTFRKRGIEIESNSKMKDLNLIRKQEDSNSTDESWYKDDSFVFGLKNQYEQQDENKFSDFYDSAQYSESDEMKTTKQQGFIAIKLRSSLSQSILNPLANAGFTNLSFRKTISEPILNDDDGSILNCDCSPDIVDHLYQSELETDVPFACAQNMPIS